MPSPLKIAIASFLVTASAIKAAPALAEPTQPQNVAVVHTADLDLSTKIAQRELDHRLIVAAADVCGTASDADLAGQNALRQCRKDVLAKARASKDAQLAARDGASLVLAARR